MVVMVTRQPPPWSICKSFLHCMEMAAWSFCCNCVVVQSSCMPLTIQKCIVVYMHVYLYTHIYGSCSSPHCCFGNLPPRAAATVYPIRLKGTAGAKCSERRRGDGCTTPGGGWPAARAVDDVRLLRSIGKSAVAAGPHHRRPS